MGSRMKNIQEFSSRTRQHKMGIENVKIYELKKQKDVFNVLQGCKSCKIRICRVNDSATIIDGLATISAHGSIVVALII